MTDRKIFCDGAEKELRGGGANSSGNLAWKLVMSFLIISFLVSGCTKPETDRVYNNSPFKLKINQSAFLDYAEEPQENEDGKLNKIKIQFLDVLEDSRCPSDVQCVWEGRAVILLKITVDNGSLRVDEPKEFFINLSTVLTESQSKAKFDGHTIFLKELEPYPLSSRQIKKNDYIATLIVTG